MRDATNATAGVRRDVAMKTLRDRQKATSKQLSLGDNSTRRRAEWCSRTR